MKINIPLIPDGLATFLSFILYFVNAIGIGYLKFGEYSGVKIAILIFLPVIDLYIYGSMIIHGRREHRKKIGVYDTANHIKTNSQIDNQKIKQDNSFDTSFKSENTKRLILLFESMERTMFIYQHNINADLSRDKEEEFWLEYYMDFINGRLKAAFSETFIKMDKGDLRDMLKKGTKSVYDINVDRLIGKEEMENLKTENDKGRQLELLKSLVAASNSGEGRDYYNKIFDLKKRDSLRDTLEKLIDSVFYNPDQVREMINQHWGRDSMRAFESQINNRMKYSKEVWRNSFSVDWMNGML